MDSLTLPSLKEIHYRRYLRQTERDGDGGDDDGIEHVPSPFPFLALDLAPFRSLAGHVVAAASTLHHHFRLLGRGMDPVPLVDHCVVVVGVVVADPNRQGERRLVVVSLTCWRHH